MPRQSEIQVISKVALVEVTKEFLRRSNCSPTEVYYFGREKKKENGVAPIYIRYPEAGIITG